MHLIQAVIIVSFHEILEAAKAMAMDDSPNKHGGKLLYYSVLEVGSGHVLYHGPSVDMTAYLLEPGTRHSIQSWNIYDVFPAAKRLDEMVEAEGRKG